MEFIRYDDISKEEWDAGIDSMPDCPLGYTGNNMEFLLEYSQSIVKNESFLVKNNGKIMAAAMAFIEAGQEDARTIGWAGGSCLAPYLAPDLPYKQQERDLKKIMEYIDGLGAEFRCGEIRLRLDPLSNPCNTEKILNYNYLLKHGYSNCSSLTQMIDLRKDVKELYSDIKKGHKADIKKGEAFQLEFYDQTGITGEKMNQYREIYEYDAGRVTRNSQMTHHYLRFIEDGQGILGLARIRGGGYIAAILATLHHGKAYYSSYCEKTDCMGGIPAGHILQWELMKLLKERGIAFYEIGEQYYPDINSAGELTWEEQKRIRISAYKRMFGGYTVSLFGGIKRRTAGEANAEGRAD